MPRDLHELARHYCTYSEDDDDDNHAGKSGRVRTLR
jgi:hypothetical protein